MFGLLKKIFKKDADGLSASSPVPQAPPAFSRTATPSHAGRSAGNPFSGAPSGGGATATATASTPAPVSAPPLSAAAAVRPTAKPASGELPETIALPLDTVLAGLPPELQGFFKPNVGADVEIQLSLQTVLPQLSSGKVRVPFGDVRNACPNGSCHADDEHDEKQVELPLACILSRINPALLPRRTQRQLMDVPKDVTGLFGSIGEPISSTPAGPATPAATQPAAEPAKAEARAKVPAPKPTAGRKKAVPDDIERIPSPFSMPTAKSAPEPEPVPSPAAEKPVAMPTAPKRRSAVPDDIANIPSPFSFPGASAPQPAAAAPEPVSEPEEMPKIKFNPGLAAASVSPAVNKLVSKAPASGAVRPAAAQLQVVKDDNYLGFSLREVTEGWEEKILAEIHQAGLENAQLELPVGEVDLAMRKGKIAFPWKTLRGWLEPSPEGDSEHEGVEVTLPLKVVAPKFLALRKPKSGQRKAHVEESIPDLFSGGPEPVPVAAPAPVAPVAAAEVEPAVAKPAKSGKASERKAAVAISAANPNELVAKTAQLAGVTGALLAMNDGLVVASQLPKPLQGETVAAFLPQIFGRLNQFSTELKLGDLSSVMLVMDNCPWIIFRTGKVYFAVVGQSGEALPLPQLTAIVAEIKRQNL